MCKCVNVNCGSYDNQVEVEAPLHMKNKKIGSCMQIYDTICIDKCIVEEVQSLWALGISTVGCCCGHNKPIGYIQVIKSDEEKMIELGYKVDSGSIYSFFAKSVT